jgi:8-oxo-dGTP pyrophosphatase MutT (NUDIX family)
MDPGESAEEACVREVLEETGLMVKVTRLVGVYTSPHILVEYPDGNKIQPVGFSFEAEVIGGELGLSDETTAYEYIAIGELDTIDVMEHHRQRIDDAVKNQTAAVFR